MPTFVGAGLGGALVGGGGAINKTGCTAGNLIIVHSFQAGTSGNQSFINESNIEAIDGTDNAITGIATGAVGSPTVGLYDLWIGRVMADGTCSGDIDSPDDAFARMYEFDAVSAGTTIATIYEETTAGNFNFGSGTSTTIADESVTTIEGGRLALQFISVFANQALSAFSGESGGNWIEPVSAFSSGAGATGTIGIQTADMPTAGTIDGGTITISSNPWANIGFALIPANAADIAWLRA